MRLEEQMKSGLLYREYGHKDPVDQEYEKIIEKQRVNAKEMMFDFNNTRPSDMETRTKILNELLGSVGKGISFLNHLHILLMVAILILAKISMQTLISKL